MLSLEFLEFIDSIEDIDPGESDETGRYTK